MKNGRNCETIHKGSFCSETIIDTKMIESIRHNGEDGTSVITMASGDKIEVAHTIFDAYLLVGWDLYGNKPERKKWYKFWTRS